MDKLIEIFEDVKISRIKGMTWGVLFAMVIFDLNEIVANEVACVLVGMILAVVFLFAGCYRPGIDTDEEI